LIEINLELNFGWFFVENDEILMIFVYFWVFFCEKENKKIKEKRKLLKIFGGDDFKNGKKLNSYFINKRKKLNNFYFEIIWWVEFKKFVCIFFFLNFLKKESLKQIRLKEFGSQQIWMSRRKIIKYAQVFIINIEE
jgi:hypothetical protein